MPSLLDTPTEMRASATSGCHRNLGTFRVRCESWCDARYKFKFSRDGKRDGDARAAGTPRLPVGTPLSPHETDVPSPRFEAATSTSDSRSETDGLVTILLVEDERALRDVIRRQLVRHGYQVMTASDGAEALDVAVRHQQKVDLVITDVVMPNMKGNELAEQLAAVRPETKVIFISGFTKSLLQNHHMDSLLEKPFSESDLIDHVHRALGTDEDPELTPSGDPAC